MTGVDAYSPAEIARLVETKGVAKARADIPTTFVLGVLAGAFIALGGVLSTTVAAGWEGSYGLGRWIAGIAFSLGLILVVVAGAELFTGNNLIVMSVVSGHIGVAGLLRNWVLVYAGNLVGATSVAVFVWLARWWELGDGVVGVTAVGIADAKADLGFGTVFVRGILANALVCLAVWLATGGRSLVDKVVAIVFPISAFVAAGFEHSIANLYFLPAGMLIGSEIGGGPSVGDAVRNIVAATLGNIVGGSVLVGLVYWFVYLRPTEDPM
jgi:formate/nitrite transporter